MHHYEIHFSPKHNPNAWSRVLPRKEYKHKKEAVKVFKEIKTDEEMKPYYNFRLVKVKIKYLVMA